MTRFCIIMFVRVDAQYSALFPVVPLFQSHEESFKDFCFQPLAISDA